MMRGYSSLAAVAALVVGTQAGAQNIDSIGSQIDFIRFTTTDRPEEQEQDAGDAAAEFTDGEAPKVNEFTFSIVAPFSYNSNAFKTDTGRIDDVHLSPRVGLAWEKSVLPKKDGKEGRVTLNASLYLNYDEYVDLAAADQSLVLGSIGAVFGNPKKKIAPYISYAPALAYGDFYDDHRVTLHDFSAGLRRLLVIGKDKGGKTTTTLLIDAAYTRREASLAVVEQHRPTLTLKFSGRLANEIAWTVKPQLQGQWYTGGVNDGREDYNFKLSAGIDWTLPLTHGSKPASPDKIYLFSFNIVLERNESDFPGKDYTLWDIGPAFSLIRKF